MEQTKFTIQEIKNYLMKQESLGDAIYFLSAEQIIEANTIEEDEDF